MIEITAEIRALIDKAAAGMELAGDEYTSKARWRLSTFRTGTKSCFPSIRWA